MSAHSSERSPRFCQSLLEESAPAVAGVRVCARESERERERACVSVRLPANNLTSHGACFFLNFNEKSTGNISLRFLGSPAQKLQHFIKTASPRSSRLLLLIIS